MKRWALIATVLVGCSLSFAHEFWVEPGKFRPRVGEYVAVHLLVGDGLPGEHRKRDSKRIESLGVLGPGETVMRAIPGKDGSDPVGAFIAEKSETYVLGYRGREATINLESKKFEAYLREEGLLRVIDRRRELGESEKPGREAYSRCAKALVCAGGKSDGAWDKRLGWPLEIVPEKNPYLAHAGARLAFILLENGKPVTGAQVSAFCRVDGKNIRLTQRTDGDGRVSFEMKDAGFWLINTVRMERASGRSDVDWVSIWSSLTFELAA